jgi:hypothetical protein
MSNHVGKGFLHAAEVPDAGGAEDRKRRSDIRDQSKAEIGKAEITSQKLKR